MKRLLQFLKPYRKEAILAPLFKMLEASFELFVPLVVAGIGVGAWWFLPIFKRKKKQETVEN